MNNLPPLRNIAKWVVCPLALLIAGGCSPPSSLRPQSMLSCNHAALKANGGVAGPALVAAAYGSVSDIPLNAVTVLDKSAYQSVVTQSLFSERLDGQSVRVVVRLANCTDADVQLRARTQFLRDDQSPAESVSAWQTVHVPPRGLAVYDEISLGGRDVASYLVELGSDQ